MKDNIWDSFQQTSKNICVFPIFLIEIFTMLVIMQETLEHFI